MPRARPPSAQALDDERKEREDEIVQMQAFPLCMGELSGEIRRHRVGPQLFERGVDGVPADDPEHVKAAQCIH